MSYLFFRVMMLFLSIMGIFSMIMRDDFTYILFPICMIVFVLFSFFDEDDKEYMRRNHPNSSGSWFYPENGYYNSRQYSTKPATSHTKTVTVPNPEYKKIVKRCRKSVNITVDKLIKKGKNNGE